jgi:hypothetical protein
MIAWMGERESGKLMTVEEEFELRAEVSALRLVMAVLVACLRGLPQGNEIAAVAERRARSIANGTHAKLPRDDLTDLMWKTELETIDLIFQRP